MNKIAKFEKVSFEQFKKDWMKNFPNCTNVKEIYDNIKLPKRATVGSAGYDFYAPADVTIEKGKSTLIPTGIRSKIADGWVLDFSICILIIRSLNSCNQGGCDLLICSIL